jgi:hypothetical protein
VTLFFVHPLDKQDLELLARVNTFVDQQRIHRIDRRLESFVSVTQGSVLPRMTSQVPPQRGRKH